MSNTRSQIDRLPPGHAQRQALETYLRDIANDANAAFRDYNALALEADARPIGQRARWTFNP